MSKTEKKIFILDTSVLIHDPGVIEHLGNNDIVIPLRATEELDKGKNGQDLLGISCREVSRKLDYYRNKGAQHHRTLKTGIPTDAGGMLYVDYARADWKELPDELERNNDNRILLVAVAWQKKKKPNNVILLTKDINLRLKADSCGINTEDYTHDQQINTLGALYSGVVTIPLPLKLAHLKAELGSNGKIEATQIIELPEASGLLPNACCYLTFGDKYTLAIYDKANNIFIYVHKPKPMDPTKRGLLAKGPINTEQALAYDMLLNPNIKIVTLVGKTGTGKTLLAILAAMKLLGDGAFTHQHDGKPSRILVWRPNIEIAKSLGYLPGSESEKFAPYCGPIIENMRLILGKKYKKDGDTNYVDPVAEYIHDGLMEIKPINFALGSTKHHCVIIVDEAQNLTPRQIAALITRVGENSKIILTGDPNQIYTPYLSPINNGLTYVVERLKGYDMFGHMTMFKSERSAVAELAATVLC